MTTDLEKFEHAEKIIEGSDVEITPKMMRIGVLVYQGFNSDEWWESQHQRDAVTQIFKAMDAMRSLREPEVVDSESTSE